MCVWEGRVFLFGWVWGYEGKVFVFCVSDGRVFRFRRVGCL